MSDLAQAEARTMANRILNRALYRPPAAPPLQASRSEIQASPLDWAAEWLRQRLPLLSHDMRRRLVLASIAKRDIGRMLTGWEREIVTAWDDAVRQERDTR